MRPHATPGKKKRSQSSAVQPAPPVKQNENEPDRSENRRNRMIIVGVGASAGGLEAFRQLLEQLPLDTGMGFVLVQHLDPKHESALTHILARATCSA